MYEDNKWFFFQTPLHLAVITHQAVMVKWLVEAGADVNLMDRHGQTSLLLACKYEDIACVKAICDAVGEDKNKVKVDSRNFQGAIWKLYRVHALLKWKNTKSWNWSCCYIRLGLKTSLCEERTSEVAQRNSYYIGNIKHQKYLKLSVRLKYPSKTGTSLVFQINLHMPKIFTFQDLDIIFIHKFLNHITYMP